MKLKKRLACSREIGGVSDLIDDYQLCLLDVLQSEADVALRLGPVKDLHEVGHLLEADRVAAVYSLKAESGGDYRLAGPPGLGKTMMFP